MAKKDNKKQQSIKSKLINNSIIRFVFFGFVGMIAGIQLVLIGGFVFLFFLTLGGIPSIFSFIDSLLRIYLEIVLLPVFIESDIRFLIYGEIIYSETFSGPSFLEIFFLGYYFLLGVLIYTVIKYIRKKIKKLRIKPT